MIRLLDKYLTTKLFAPLARLQGANELAISILMYHSVSTARETEGHPYFWVNTTPEVFGAQMRFLKQNKYKVISLSNAAELLYSRRAAAGNEKYVVITFDDGFEDFHRNAFPILKRYGFTATVFLPTDFIEDRDLKMDGKEHLTWSQIIELNKQGISFGSHTASHPQLKFFDKADIRTEIERSKELIEHRLGAHVESFSYPFAFPEEDPVLTEYLSGTLADCGYKFGVSTRIGRATSKDPKYFLKRLPINSRDDLGLFKAKLEGGYDWLHCIQFNSKLLRARLRNVKKSA